MSQLPLLPYQPNKANENLSADIDRDDMLEIETEVSHYFGKILGALRIDTTDEHLKETPRRFAKLLVREACRGRYEPEPVLTTFPATDDGHAQFVAVGPLTVRSLCAHHFCPIIGSCYIAYKPSNKLLGLSKFSRLLDWYARRPQTQESLTDQIASRLFELLDPLSLSVAITATHSCMTWRGVEEHPMATMRTIRHLSGFGYGAEAEAEAEFRAQFLNFLPKT